MRKFKGAAIMTIVAMFCTACSSGASSATQTTAAAKTEAAAEASEAADTAGEAEKKDSAVDWPEKEVTLVVPASAGGGTDQYARALSAYFQKKTGQAMVVENQTTGNGTVAYEEVRTAKNDGYTLLLYHPSFYISYYTGQYKYDPIENFTPLVSCQQSSGQCIVVRSDSKWQSLQELVDDAKARPGEILCGIQNSSTTQFIFNLLQKDADVEFKMVEAGSQSDKIAALLGGHIEVCAIGAAAAQQYEESGEMRVLAITSQEPSEFFPDYETAVDMGYENTWWTSGQVIYGPKDMDPAAAEAINEIYKDFAEDPEVQEQLKQQQVTCPYRTLEECREWAETQNQMVKSVADILGYQY